LAEELTIMVHSQEELENAITASEILFGKSTGDDLKKLNARQFMEIFEGVQQATVSRSDIESGLGIIDALSGKTGFLSSNGEARRDLQSNAISVNKEKIDEQFTLTTVDLVNDKFILLGKGKKTNFIIVVE
jgi:tyrosyl-tRNA synthetase